MSETITRPSFALACATLRGATGVSCSSGDAIPIGGQAHASA